MWIRNSDRFPVAELLRDITYYVLARQSYKRFVDRQNGLWNVLTGEELAKYFTWLVIRVVSMYSRGGWPSRTTAWFRSWDLAVVELEWGLWYNELPQYQPSCLSRCPFNNLDMYQTQIFLSPITFRLLIQNRYQSMFLDTLIVRVFVKNAATAQVVANSAERRNRITHKLYM